MARPDFDKSDKKICLFRALELRLAQALLHQDATIRWGHGPPRRIFDVPCPRSVWHRHSNRRDCSPSVLAFGVLRNERKELSLDSSAEEL